MRQSHVSMQRELCEVSEAFDITLRPSSQDFILLYFILIYSIRLFATLCKFPGQGLNPRHSSDLNCCSDNAGPLTPCAAKEAQQTHILNTPLKYEQM